ncbi:hypothetical protein BDW02DRAFT_321570 [Decorospora gaudefroyi]|uniref:Uncharacterized protein n=1 Tax=Decorospora gaudefroyi TaxID=184978 RepID=A0A6A5KFS2_9PLEO|nr:hypothetical protein BDW02DRAFT_321570 [Decorospora gaudefroyi]
MLRSYQNFRVVGMTVQLPSSAHYMCNERSPVMLYLAKGMVGLPSRQMRGTWKSSSVGCEVVTLRLPHVDPMTANRRHM